MLIRIKTNDYEIKRGRHSGGSCQVGMPNKWKNMYVNAIPIPFNKKETINDDMISLESNVIYKRLVSNRNKGNTINIGKEYIGANLLIFPFDDSEIHIKSEYNNYIIKKAFKANNSACISLPLSYKDNVLSSFILKNESFNIDEWQLVDYVQCKPSGNREKDVLIYLPIDAVDEDIVSFEDDYFEY